MRPARPPLFEKGALLTSTDCFDHLAALVEQLPEMQAMSERLARSEAARIVADCRREAVSAEASLAAADRAIAQAEEALAVARQACDTEGIDHATRDTLFWGQQRGLRVGPANNARAALADALAAGGFSDEAEASRAVLDDDERARLAGAIASYRSDYAQTLAACEAAEEAAG